ncbi:MAG: 1-acyl-sn-glycerol-3-phosphate acyltransferase [Candidatus Bipolaricaulota bacterium]|nr:1-acyl-sn-glycerol-3-phosphate acyltransferase [Candidatus Bipolaricaulota bacterium]MDW8151904.1 lysophospholipid acyltransferase family protein [Candidatus Bipolaricaulota bacterium]
MLRWLKGGFVALALETAWFAYWVFMWLLTTAVRTRRVGERPKPPCVLAVTHVGGFEPLFVTRASGHWRGWALYSMDRSPALVRFLCRAFWRFGVTQDPARRAQVNPQTLERAVQYLKRGGSLMVFPEGDKFWERRLYRGAALLAKRAGVPLIPVGLENALVYRPGEENLPLWRGFPRALGRTLRKRWIAVHFAAPIRPDPALPEEEDVDRMMRALARAFTEFYRTFYGLPGPVWTGGRKAG